MNLPMRDFGPRPAQPAAGQARDGFALAGAVMAMVLIGALVTGGFLAASQENRLSATTRATFDAVNLAEYGLNEITGRWLLKDYEAIAVNGTRADSGYVTAGSRRVGRYDVEVRRLPGSGRLFAVVSTGQVLRGGRYAGATRRLAAVVRTRNFAVAIDRAVQVHGAMAVGGAAQVSGDDASPSSWDPNTCSSLGAQTGVVARDTSVVSTFGGGSISGSPAERQDDTMDAGSFTNFGDFDYDQVKSMASKIIPHGTVVNNTAPSLTASGACNTSDPRNWGATSDRTHPCHLYFPVIHATGNVTINSNASGQGILLVDGDLHIAGGYDFNGIIIVKGKFSTGSGNAALSGTVLIASGAEVGISSGSVLTGSPIMQFSSCAIDRAIRFNQDLGRARGIGERGWVDLSAAGLERF